MIASKELMTVVISMICILNASNVCAAWSSNPLVNNAISTATGDQDYPVIIEDGNGGAIITWQDLRNGSDQNIYAQKINANGVVQWTGNGVAICTAIGDQLRPKIISDGNGGAIITWYDYRIAANSDIYAQKINADGAIQWAANGVVICSAIRDQYGPTLISDGNGGAIITWYDYRIAANSDIYVQKISGSGVVQWTGNGVAICTAANLQQAPMIISDGSGGAIITWYDWRNGYNSSLIYAQKINANGIAKWTANGVAIRAATGVYAESSTLVSDGSGGAIITWQEFYNGGSSSDADIYVQRINANGVVQWTANGVAICTATDEQSEFNLISDGNGGAIIAWIDWRNRTLSGDYYIYAQRINASGLIQWTENGVLINTAPYWTKPALISDANGGAIIAWQDTRNAHYNIYTQRVNSNGLTQWTENGVEVSTADSQQWRPTITSDANGGAIITWYDLRNGNYDIFAQRIKANGTFPTYGSLQVSLIPQGVIADDAQWQIDGGIWQDSGTTLPDLSVGEHTIAFKSVIYWTKPANQTITIVKDQTLTAMGVYVRLVKGDVNGDGMTDLADAILCLQILCGLTPDNVNPAVDVEGNGKIGMDDAIYAIQKAAGF